jgi:hypothetical protein
LGRFDRPVHPNPTRTPDTAMPRQDLRPGLAEPVYLIVSRAQVETGDATQPLRWLHSLSSDPRTARAFMGRVSVIVEGYDDDPRELFEIAQVRAFVGQLDEQWPYWFFFLSQMDDSIKLIESCLCETIEVVPGVASFDFEQLERYLARHFTAFNRLCEAVKLPPETAEAISEEIIRLFQNAAVDRLEGDG